VKTIRKGPANIPDIIAKKKVYKDADFTGLDSVFWKNTADKKWADATRESKYNSGFYFGTYKFMSWHSFSQLKVFDTNDGPDF
jgi:hypothetical protein